MSRVIGLRPSPALVVASLALLVSLAGTGYAAVALPANSVGNKQLQANVQRTVGPTAPRPPRPASAPAAPTPAPATTPAPPPTPGVVQPCRVPCKK